LSNPCSWSLAALDLCELGCRMTQTVNFSSRWSASLFHWILYWITAKCCNGTNLNHNELGVQILLKLDIHSPGLSSPHVFPPSDNTLLVVNMMLQNNQRILDKYKLYWLVFLPVCCNMPST
jgi:hypothetical protein